MSSSTPFAVWRTWHSFLPPWPLSWPPLLVWRQRKFSGSSQARRSQEQISGHTADHVFYIGTVEYDGLRNGILLEAKGSSYLKFFNKDGTPKHGYATSGEFNNLIAQARAQLKAAQGIRVQWHVAEHGMDNILRYHFERAEIHGIEVIHTPPLP
ncbi:Tox-REase-5 domain-containing protein [Stigmatella aurantiaca]|uniref:Tox-REase-5 domain-containing protein n=1 Tax=Stigmatella aurantiaca TaxID=41 RepID=UPI001E35D56D|nr:Tox-REase-5 domain-containing protein [Stigmatella aurantiaca]